MAHQDIPEAGVTRALAFGLRMTPAEIAKGRYMRAPDHDAAPSRGEMQASVQDFIADQFLGGADEPEEETDEIPEGDEPEGEEAEGDTPEAEETTDENSEAPEPIAAPVSWDKDAKEAFAQLPRELQATVAEREAQRDKAIQSATTEAANAKRNALAEANAMFADQQRQYAQHLEQLAAQNAPQRPDPALAAQDPGAYVQALAYFEAHNAQHQELMQQAAHAKNEATRREAITRQHEIAKDQEALATALGDDWTDTGKRQALLTSLQEVGATLGYPVELMGQANATDILALKAAAGWKAKADKYDALQSNKMAAVRAAKDAPRVAKPGTSQTRAETSSRSRSAAWDAVKSSRGKNGDAAATYLESMGIKL
jgi:hypothetical protein